MLVPHDRQGGSPMVTNHAKLLQQMKEYAGEYVTFEAEAPEGAMAEANADLKQIITGLEALLASQDVAVDGPRLSRRIDHAVGNLRRHIEQQSSHSTHESTLSAPKR